MSEGPNNIYLYQKDKTHMALAHDAKLIGSCDRFHLAVQDVSFDHVLHKDSVYYSKQRLLDHL